MADVRNGKSTSDWLLCYVAFLSGSHQLLLLQKLLAIGMLPEEDYHECIACSPVARSICLLWFWLLAAGLLPWSGLCFFFRLLLSTVASLTCINAPKSDRPAPHQQRNEVRSSLNCQLLDAL